jgi:hypothetical protein
MARTDEQLRREVGAEREKLVEAVEALRGEAADIRGRMRARLPLAAVGALGIGAAMRLLRRRGLRGRR